MPNPLFSIVTTVRNAENLIQGCIENVLGQTYPNIEYIIVDGNSSDKTLERIEPYRSKIKHVISEPDKGIYDGMNKGIRLATGEWIHLINVDDRYCTHDSITNIVPQLIHDRVNYCDILREYENGDVQKQIFPFKKWKLLLSAFLPHPGLIVSREQYQKHGLYDIEYKIAADHEFILRLLKHYKVNHINNFFTTMKQGGFSAKHFALTIEEFKDVSIKYGCPKLIANLMARYKKYTWSKVL